MSASIHRALLTLGLLLASPPLVGAQLDAQIRLGDQFTGVLAADTGKGPDQDVLAFEGIAGQLCSVTVKGQGGTLAVATLFDAATESFIDSTAFEKGFGTSSFKIVKFPLPFTGDYLLAIDPSVPGSAGPYVVKTKGQFGKDLKSIKVESVSAPGGAADVTFDAPAGAFVKAKVGPGKGSAAIPSVVGMLTPHETITDLAPYAKIKKNKTTIKNAPVTVTGTHVLLVDNLGAAGSIKRSAKVVFPKFKKAKYDEGGVGSISGTVSVQDLPAMGELEPNDAVADTQFIGALATGGVLRVVGSVGPANPDDVDGFRIQLDSDQTVNFTLHHDSQASDLDIYLFETVEPYNLITSFATANVPESGAITFSNVPAGFTFDVLIAGFDDTVGDYLLTVSSGGSGAGLVAPLAHDPAEPPADPLHGALRADGQQIVDARMGLDRPFVPSELVVKLHDPERDVRDWAAERGYAVRIDSPSGYFVTTLPDYAGLDDRSARLGTLRTAGELQRDPTVASAQVNQLWQILQTPNDEFLPFQWHFPVMRVNEAWGITTGSADVLVAVIDTGITPHPDLVARDSGTGFDMISLPQISRDGDGIDSNPTDVGDLVNNGISSFHGSHVAGTVGASTNNGIGVAGVDWACQLMHVRVLGQGGGTSFDIAEGIRWASRQPNASFQLPPKAADVINMSLGGGGFDNNVNDACQDAIAAGVSIIAAAGNENSSQVSYPAGYDNVIAVGAVDIAEQRAPYSNFGSWVDLCAPGGNMGVDLNGDSYADGVLSTKYSGGDLSQSQPVYAFENGTSMASPHVAGLVGLMRALDGDITPAQIETVLESTAKAIATDQPIGPLCDAVEALKAVQDGVGGGGDDPVLAVSTTQLNFGATTTVLNVGLSNVGGGTLNVNAPQVTESNGNGWLSAGFAGNALQVTVNRNGQAPGGYSGSVLLTSDGGNATINVSMSVTGGVQGVLDMGDIFVLAVDPQTLVTEGQAIVSAQNGNYGIDTSDGDWLVVAGPDLDNDGFICGPGEPCGFFPVVSDPVLVKVEFGQGESGVDFLVVDALSLPASAPDAAFVPPAEGFRLQSSDAIDAD